jgi:hypothetical protein
MALTQLPSQAALVASNAWLGADGGCIFADAHNAVTSAAVILHHQHASKHNAATGHPVITSFEPGEPWFYDYRTKEVFAGPKLHAPNSHPLDQPVPGPAGAMPANWQALLYD